MKKQIAELKRWINDLQSGMYINCVYCGHRYGPRENTPVSMADVLKDHIAKCPKHPLSQANKKIAELKEVIQHCALGQVPENIRELFDEVNREVL